MKAEKTSTFDHFTLEELLDTVNQDEKAIRAH